MKVIYLLLLVLVVAVIGCGKNESDAAADTTVNKGASGVQSSTQENAGQGTAKTVNSPQEGSGSYRITPKDPSKFPSNAAGSNG